MSAPVLSLLSVVQAFDPTPSNAPKAPNADLVTPGVWGFVITLMIGVVTILLIIDMMRRVRRTRYRAEINAKLDAEEAERAAAQNAALPASSRGANGGAAPRAIDEAVGRGDDAARDDL